MADKLLNPADAKKLLALIKDNTVEGKNDRWGSTTYTVTDAEGKVLAEIRVDSDYGAVSIVAAGQEIASITYNVNRKKPEHNNIFEVVNAAYNRHVDTLKAKREKAKKSMLAGIEALKAQAASLDISVAELIQLIQNPKTK